MILTLFLGLFVPVSSILLPNHSPNQNNTESSLSVNGNAHFHTEVLPQNDSAAGSVVSSHAKPMIMPFPPSNGASSQLTNQASNPNFVAKPLILPTVQTFDFQPNRFNISQTSMGAVDPVHSAASAAGQTADSNLNNNGQTSAAAGNGALVRPMVMPVAQNSPATIQQKITVPLNTTKLMSDLFGGKSIEAVQTVPAQIYNGIPEGVAISPTEAPRNQSESIINTFIPPVPVPNKNSTKKKNNKQDKPAANGNATVQTQHMPFFGVNSTRPQIQILPFYGEDQSNGSYIQHLPFIQGNSTVPHVMTLPSIDTNQSASNPTKLGQVSALPFFGSTGKNKKNSSTPSTSTLINKLGGGLLAGSPFEALLSNLTDDCQNSFTEMAKTVLNMTITDLRGNFTEWAAGCGKKAILDQLDNTTATMQATYKSAIMALAQSLPGYILGRENLNNNDNVNVSQKILQTQQYMASLPETARKTLEFMDSLLVGNMTKKLLPAMTGSPTPEQTANLTSTLRQYLTSKRLGSAMPTQAKLNATAALQKLTRSKRASKDKSSSEENFEAFAEPLGEEPRHA